MTGKGQSWFGRKGVVKLGERVKVDGEELEKLRRLHGVHVAPRQRKRRALLEQLRRHPGNESSTRYAREAPDGGVECGWLVHHGTVKVEGPG
mgnify:FL=1